MGRVEFHFHEIRFLAGTPSPKIVLFPLAKYIPISFPQRKQWNFFDFSFVVALFFQILTLPL